MNKRVLITGASGFLGKMITDKILEENGYEIHTVSNSRGTDKGISHRADLLDYGQITTLMKEVKPSYLIHLAWETRPNIYLNEPANMKWLAAGMHMIEQFKANGGERIISSGTCNEYDMSYQSLHEETTPAGTDSLYGISKRSFYNTASRYCENEKISYVCGRIFFIYGENDKQNRAVPYAINNFLNCENAVCNAADAYRDYMHVADAADAFIALMKSSLTGAVNIASGIPTSMGDIFMEVAKQMNCTALLELNLMKDGVRTILADTSRMRNELGFIPRISLADGIARTIRWTKEGKLGKN